MWEQLPAAAVRYEYRSRCGRGMNTGRGVGISRGGNIQYEAYLLGEPLRFLAEKQLWKLKNALLAVYAQMFVRNKILL